MIRTLLAVSLAALIVALPASSAKQEFTISLDQAQPVSGDVTFTVTRSSIRKHDPQTQWVAVDCYDALGAETSSSEQPVQWGLWSSLVGHTWPFAVSGVECYAAVVTTLSYEPQHGDPVVEFSVAP